MSKSGADYFLKSTSLTAEARFKLPLPFLTGRGKRRILKYALKFGCFRYLAERMFQFVFCIGVSGGEDAMVAGDKTMLRIWKYGKVTRLSEYLRE